VSAYRQLHSLGVVHNDVSPRHWLRGVDGQIRIIDFDVAEHFEPGEADEAFECEDQEVRWILGLDAE
jgi:tRNA A-37 threonylcarbamoyl transferase component Bud32